MYIFYSEWAAFKKYPKTLQKNAHQPTTARQYRSETKKNILEYPFRSVLPQFKKYHPSGNLKFNKLDIFQSLKLRNLMGNILRISLKLNFTPNTSGCYGLMKETGMSHLEHY